MTYTKLDSYEADLHVWVSELEDNQKSLAWLTRPDYRPEENSDDEFRERDIEWLENQIAEAIGEIKVLKAKIAREEQKAAAQ